MLEVSGVTKRFGGLVAVSSVDLSVQPGEIVSLIGPNGAGKQLCLPILPAFKSLMRAKSSLRAPRLQE